MARSGVTRRPDGGAVVRLSPGEHRLLSSLPDQLRPIVAGEQDIAGAHDRLYPPGYADAALDAEYRDLVGEALVVERLERLEAFAATLQAGRRRGLWWTIELDAEQIEGWVSAVNDARLVLGCFIGIADESQWERGPDTGDVNSVALYYLGWLQEELIEALMHGLPGGPQGVE